VFETIGIAVLVLVLILIGAVFVFIGTRPGSFRIERSAPIGAPPDVVFSIVNDLHQWGRWSPYDKRDPAMKKTFEGASAGPGAVYAWNGNNQVGEGRLTIMESKPGELVSMKLEFFRPFACTNKASFTMAPSEGGTRVTWAMEGKNTLMGKAISLFMDMDKMVGKDFEEGLANLNAAAEAETQKVR
jgi:Polyketide cyclase / dehydrase and lipid transport